MLIAYFFREMVQIERGTLRGLGTLWKVSLPGLDSVPEVAAKLKEPNTQERKFEDVVKDAEQATVHFLVY